MSAGPFRLISFAAMMAATMMLVPPSRAGEKEFASSRARKSSMTTAASSALTGSVATSAEVLGKRIFFDKSLSIRPGMACASCHSPSAGFSYPDSRVNETLGPVPGIIPGRFGHRKPPSMAYAAFSPDGPYYDSDLQVWLGGTFWDGRAPNTEAQARLPFLDPNEMANIADGPVPPHAGGLAPLVAEKLRLRPYSWLFVEVFGPGFLLADDSEVETMATKAIAAYDGSSEVSAFSSKYDASPFGVPAQSRYQLSASEERGRTLFFGKAQCSACHSSATLAPVLDVSGGRDTFTMYCFANVGVPKNPRNPFYGETNSKANPLGSNPLGSAYVDYGLGANPNPAPDGSRFQNKSSGDIVEFRGLFKAPTVRNADRRPSPNFVKAYMHNGVFRSLEEVVHFYNKRNIAVNPHGREVAFDLRVGPPAGFTRLFDPPEVIDNVQNVAGATPDEATDDVASNGQVGHLGLTSDDEADLIRFLKTLTDGFTPGR